MHIFIKLILIQGRENVLIITTVLTLPHTAADMVIAGRHHVMDPVVLIMESGLLLSLALEP